MAADTQTLAPPTPRRSRYRPTRVAALAVAIALLAGLLGGFWIRDMLVADRTGPGAVDIGFAQDMSTHHNQAVEMSAMALSQALDPAVRTLAFDVLTNQQSQIGTMRGWLSMWDQPTASEQPMLWMSVPISPTTASGHQMSGHTGMKKMPGMATTEELATLRRTQGAEFDTLYLQLLLRHHEGGLAMARYARDNATVAVVATLARQIDSAQTAESQTLRDMLTQRNTPTLPMN